MPKKVEREICPCCKGSRLYIGFSVKEDCKTCEGEGTIAVKKSLQKEHDTAITEDLDFPEPWLDDEDDDEDDHEDVFWLGGLGITYD